MDKEKSIQLIREFIRKLDQDDFDLEAWKNSVTLILERVFGPGALIINKIQSLSYHMSSWALRDTLGKSSWEEQIKRNAREILETAIMELEIAGTGEYEPAMHTASLIISEALENELTGSQYKELKAILKENDDPALRREKISEYLRSLDTETLQNILSTLLSDERVTGNL